MGKISYRTISAVGVTDEHRALAYDWTFDNPDDYALYLFKYEDDKPVRYVYSDNGNEFCPEDMYLNRNLSAFVTELNKVCEELQS